MRRFLVLIVILASFAPVFRPLAHSAAPGKVCTLKGRTCAMHGHACAHDHGRKEAHASCGAMHGMETHHDSGAAKGGAIIKCGCGKDDSGVINMQEDPFVTGRLPMPIILSAEILKANMLLSESEPFLPVVQRPPIA